MKIEKFEKLHDKTEYIFEIRNLKQELNYVLILEKFHRIIKFNKKAGLQPHIGNMEITENIEMLNS